MTTTEDPGRAAYEALWQDLLDKSDRTSPAEYPDHALITFEEFCDYLQAARSASPAVEDRRGDREAVARIIAPNWDLTGAGQDERLRQISREQTLRKVEQILALFPKEPEGWRIEAARPLIEAARGLSFGTDWNGGTQAKLHGYRQKLLDALPAALAALPSPPKEPA